MRAHNLNAIAALTALSALPSVHSQSNASPGCSKSLPNALTPGGPTANFTLNSTLGGGERKYLVHLPSTYSPQNNKPAPLILVFHGLGMRTTSMETNTQFSLPEMNPDHIAVYPEGLNRMWLGDPAAPNATVVDDRRFVSDLLDSLEDTLCIDTARIYSAGFSNGGGLSGLLSCGPYTAPRIAAFGGVAAADYTNSSLGYSLFEEEACDPGTRKRPIPYLDIHGDSDKVIAYNGDNSAFDVDGDGVPDANTMPIPQWVRERADMNGCGPTAANTTTQIEGGTVQRSAWMCDNNEDVVVGYFVQKLGHGWPSTTPQAGIFEEFRGGPTTWNASTVLLEWFARWTLPVA
ncbi:hypothetical protein ACN47E_002814 [Coniothyrium glycines]